MKKIIISTLLISGILGGLMGQAYAAETSQDTTGNVGFKTPTTGGLTMTDTNALNLNFGSNEISANDQVYKNTEDTKATVQDIRGTATGWTLTVAQAAQFKVEKSGETLDGAQITIETPTLDGTSTAKAEVGKNLVLSTNGATQQVMGAKAGEGNGTAIADLNKGSVALSVPGKTVKVAKDYTTTLTWALSDTPANN